MSRRKSKRSTSSQSTVIAESWPVGLPVTAENIRKMQENYTVYAVESSYALPIVEDPDQESWIEAGGSTNSPTVLRTHIRELSRHVPTAKRVLDLYRFYVLGGKPEAIVCPLDSEDSPENQLTKRANKKLRRELRKLERHLGGGEMVTRLYRDGDLFIRRIPNPPEVGGYEYRFVDPEDVISSDGVEAGGVVTDTYDAVNVLYYTLCREEFDINGASLGYKEYATVSADDMIHCKLDCDSTEKRGRSRLLSCIDALQKHRNMLINEVTLRQSQSAIVMVRKVSGGTGAARSLLDASKSTTSSPNEHYSGQEKYRPGTIATTTKGVEISFAHPDNNFSDAGPLLTTLIREVAKCTGFSYEQVSCDTSEGSLASALVAESPVVKMVHEERSFLSSHLQKLFQWLLEGVPINWDDYEVQVKYPNIETQDGLKTAQEANLGVMTNSLSRKEMSRRLGADPEVMRTEIEEESKLSYINPMYANQNPGVADKQASSAGNASASGTNQGDAVPTGPSDPGKANANTVA